MLTLIHSWPARGAAGGMLPSRTVSVCFCLAGRDDGVVGSMLTSVGIWLILARDCPSPTLA
jgi:hypothetical protein